MPVSFSMLNRLLEQEVDKNPECRERLLRDGRALLRDGRKLSDEELLAKLADLGIALTRERLGDLTHQFPSAQGLALELIETSVPPIAEEHQDWVWIACTCLWERWFPDRASNEMTDDWMQAGYEASETDRVEKACALWLKTWQGIRQIMDRCRTRSVEAFDELFGGTQSVANWIQDFESLLQQAGGKDPAFWQERLSLCECVVSQLEDVHPLTRENFRRAIAESHYDLGHSEEAEALYQRWMRDDPQWGWGWIGWADLYHTFARHDALDSARAEQLLLEGLAVPEVRDREDILDRLQTVYEDLGRDADAERIAAELAALGTRGRRWGGADARAGSVTESMIAGDDYVSFRQTYDFGEEGLPLDEVAAFGESLRRGQPPAIHGAAKHGDVRRNDACPCGSGKKYKKCCGKR